MTGFTILAALGAFLVLWLAWRTVQASGFRKSAREGYFAQITPLFDRVVTRVQPSGFPRMTGHLGPHAFDLQVMQDSLTFRKLPALWVMLTLPEAMPVKAKLNIMARPSGLEPFSHFANLPQSLPCPSALPEGTGVRTDNADAVPPEALLAPHFAVFDDPKIKEMVIAPNGLRLVFLAEEADRGRFLIFRDAEMGLSPLEPTRLSPLIVALLALRRTLIEAA